MFVTDTAHRRQARWPALGPAPLPGAGIRRRRTGPLIFAGAPISLKCPCLASGIRMGDDSLITPLLAAGDEYNVDLDQDIQDIQHILNTLRSHLGMDVAFISEFIEGRRLIRYVDAKQHASALRPGDSHALPESYCHYISSGELDSIVPDTGENAVTRTMPVTSELNIANYIGVPIRLPDGSLFGSFCCFDHQTGAELDQRDLALLHAFADFAGRLISKQEEQQSRGRRIKETVLDMLEQRRLNTVFQPIFHLGERKVVGFEALTRFQSEPYRPPNQWFGDAQRVGLGLELEKLAVETALEAASAIPTPLYVSLNVSPAHLLHDHFLSCLDPWPAHRVLLEITEHARIADYQALRKALVPLRDKGVQIAVDDAGAGYASFQHVLELAADTIKLDLSLIRDIHSDRARQALAAALIRFAEVVGARVIAEGVESETELETLRGLGVDKVQGYFVGEPLDLDQALRLAALD